MVSMTHYYLSNYPSKAVEGIINKITLLGNYFIGNL